jgi:plasmid stability protein
MAVSLSIKNVPEAVVDRLRERAKRNRRSLQGELLDVVERAALESPIPSARDVYERIKKLNLPKGPSSVDIIRKTRDAR